MKVVVCALGGEVGPWDLPASRLVERTWIHGGERSLYELAVAAAAIGHDVELRGDISEPDLRDLRDSAGTVPAVGMGPRRPTADDLVIVPEGWTDPLQYARLALSPARAVILLLAPPGLFGWSFLGDWSPLHPRETSMESVARPESFRAMAAMGFELWADSPGLAEAARLAGVECVEIGHGSPLAVPEPAERTHDVAVVEANRWAEEARWVAAQLEVSHLVIPETRHAHLQRELARAKTLIWPSRIEGRARIPGEARATGTVPVALRSNRFAESLDEDRGAVAVDSLEDMPRAVAALLASPQRLERLAASGLRTAREENAWDLFMKRLDEALSELPPPDQAREARATIGEELAALIRRREEELDRARKGLQEAEGAFQALRGRRSVRWAVRVAQVARPWFALKERRRGS
jgi:glycosyltransferase involved in cell wall biosynthesis